MVVVASSPSVVVDSASPELEDEVVVELINSVYPKATWATKMDKLAPGLAIVDHQRVARRQNDAKERCQERAQHGDATLNTHSSLRGGWHHER